MTRNTTTKPPNQTQYTPIPTSEPPEQTQPTYVILQFYPHRTTCFRYLRRTLILTLSLLFLSLTIYLIYPSDPELRLVRVKLNHVRVYTRTHPPSLDLSLAIMLKVRNRDLLSLSYESLTVAISYRGRKLGFVSSNGGEIKAKESSYVNATLDVDGFEVLHDIFYLIEDVASGSVPFDTISSIDGYVGLFFIKIPIQAKVSCEVDVNPVNHKIIRQNCYPELQEAESPSPY